MKKIIIAISVVLAGVIAYSFMGGSETDSTETESPEKGFSIRKSFKSILPGDQVEENQLAKHEAGDHVVVIESKPYQIEVDEAEERIEALKDMKDNEAIDFARWTLFSENSKYTVDEKEKLLDKAIEVLRPEEKQMLLRDVIFLGNERSLQDKAIAVLGQGMEKAQLEAFVTEVVRMKPAPPGKAAVIEFAATRNIYVK